MVWVQDQTGDCLVNGDVIIIVLLCYCSIDYRIDKDQQRRLVFQRGENGVYTMIYAKVKKTR